MVYRLFHSGIISYTCKYLQVVIIAGIGCKRFSFLFSFFWLLRSFDCTPGAIPHSEGMDVGAVRLAVFGKLLDQDNPTVTDKLLPLLLQNGIVVSVW